MAGVQKGGGELKSKVKGEGRAPLMPATQMNTTNETTADIDHCVCLSSSLRKIIPASKSFNFPSDRLPAYLGLKTQRVALRVGQRVALFHGLM